MELFKVLVNLLLLAVLIAIFCNFLDEAIESGQFKSQFMTKIVAALVVITIFFVFFLKIQVFWAVCAQLLLVIVLCKLRNRHQNKKMDAQVIFLLDSIVLYLSSGLSFESSLVNSLNALNIEARTRLKRLLDTNEDKSAALSTNLMLFLKLVRSCRAKSFNIQGQAELLRLRLSTRTNFRSRLNQAIYQVKVQWGIVLFLYISLLGFALYRQTSELLQGYVQISILLFVLGSFIFWYVIRGFRWTV